MNNKALWAGLLLAGLTGGTAGAAEPSLCTRLAGEARQAPAAIWAAADPLAGWVEPVPAAPSSTVTALAQDARWRDLLAVSPAQPVGVQQLPGAPVYLLEHFAGTANCQSLLLVEAHPGRPSRQLAPPFAVESLELCFTRSARLARVLGQPAFIVGGAPSMISPELHYRIAAWTGQGWAQTCSLQLRRSAAMVFAQRWCAPGTPVCMAGQPLAEQLARAYEAERAGGPPLDGRALRAGRPPDAGVEAALNPPLATPGAIGDMNPPFPLFGADPARLDPMLTGFSNADPRRLSVYVDGRWWLAVVGRAGVGWREGGAVLVALFKPPGRPGDGVAAYQFRTAPAGLLQAEAVDGPP